MSATTELLFDPERFDWPALQDQYAWLRVLDDCPQDPEHHAEGNVGIHTARVVEALLALPEWADLGARERAMLYAAALLHDVAKPPCTRVGEDGRIHSPGHARQGERVARAILAELAPEAPFAFTEGICRLVRHHGLPLWFLDKPDAERAVVGASLSVDTRLLALLAEADARGRTCADAGELLARIELFRGLCRELRCYGEPRAFASDHTRFRYFHCGDACLDYAIYDDTRLEVILMAGLPGAGKDTWIRCHAPDLPVVSLDAIRREPGAPWAVDPGESQGGVAREGLARAKRHLVARQPFVWNATNVTRSRRAELIDRFAGYGARTHVVYLHTPLPRVLAQNQARPETVPESAVRRLFEKLEVPDLTEAHRLTVVEPVGGG